MCRSLGLFHVLLIALKRLIAMWYPCWPLVMCAHGRYTSAYVCLPVIEYLIAAVMHPHYASIPWPSNPDCCSSPGDLGVSASPSILSSISCKALPLFRLQRPTSPILLSAWSAESCWPPSADWWLWFGCVNWIWEGYSLKLKFRPVLQRTAETYMKHKWFLFDFMLVNSNFQINVF